MPLELPATTKDITVEWLNVVLHENGFLVDTEIISLTHESMGEGFGAFSDMAKLSIHYSKNDLNLPNTMIAKLPPIGERRETTLQLNMFEKEISFYQEIVPISPIRTPNVYYSAIDTSAQKYILLMEDCSYCTSLDPNLRGFNQKEMYKLVLQLGDFHSRWWDDQRLSSFKWIPMPGAPEDALYSTIFRKIWEGCSLNDEFKSLLPYGAWENGLRIYEKYDSLIQSLPISKVTIIHSDLRAENFFFDWGDSDNPIVIYDWALARIGRGPVDLAFPLGVYVDTELHRKIEKDILVSYHKRLLEKGVSDYTFDECWDDYRVGLLLRLLNTLNIFYKAAQEHERMKRFAQLAIPRMFSTIVESDAVSLLV